MIFEIVSLALLLIMTILIVILVKINNTNKRLVKQLSDREDIANESYVKFLNESRDWAYEYIEDVQSSLTSFIGKVEPQLNYFNTYGRLAPSPHIIMLDAIADAFDELKAVMPESNQGEIK